jgi:20S proteasome alpha/beta subunit
MTVCVALLCLNGYSVVGASDRMLSTSDNQFKRSKIYNITKSIVMLISGDLALHSELLVNLRAQVRAAEENGTADKITVREVAEAHAALYAEAKLRVAERDFLNPVGLDRQTFLSRQKELDERFVSSLTSEMVNIRLPSCSAIFAGIDDSSGVRKAHIYSMHNGMVLCHEDSGFAAIGIGQDHAASNLMFSSYSPEDSIERGMYLAYASKTRAEVAPGVGIETDMFLISDEIIHIKEEIVSEFGNIYTEAELSHKSANEQAERKCHAFIQNIANPPPAEPAAAPENADTSPSASKTRARKSQTARKPKAS